jgi:hypothetical protein
MLLIRKKGKPQMKYAKNMKTPMEIIPFYYPQDYAGIYILAS